MQQRLTRDALRAGLSLRSDEMKRHRVFSLLKTVDDLRFFMRWHVFAVWDFMSLTKRLQHEFTTLRLPWCPPISASAARLTNEIVLCEESDETPQGVHSSHYELYLQAMEEIGADTAQIRRFVDLVGATMPVENALQTVDAPMPVRDFVNFTIDLALNGRTEEVLGAFLYGRENAIPEMFKTLLGAWGVAPKTVPTFVFYLNRHIELDGGTHGPAAIRLMHEQVGNNDDLLHSLLSSALDAVNRRIRLWDALSGALATAESGRCENTVNAPIAG